MLSHSPITVIVHDPFNHWADVSERIQSSLLLDQVDLQFKVLLKKSVNTMPLTKPVYRRAAGSWDIPYIHILVHDTASEKSVTKTAEIIKRWGEKVDKISDAKFVVLLTHRQFLNPRKVVETQTSQNAKGDGAPSAGFGFLTGGIFHFPGSSSAQDVVRSAMSRITTISARLQETHPTLARYICLTDSNAPQQLHSIIFKEHQKRLKYLSDHTMRWLSRVYAHERTIQQATVTSKPIPTMNQSPSKPDQTLDIESLIKAQPGILQDYQFRVERLVVSYLRFGETNLALQQLQKCTDIAGNVLRGEFYVEDSLSPLSFTVDDLSSSCTQIGRAHV